MHKPESDQENKTHKILGEFQVQTDHQNQTNRPDHKKAKNKRNYQRADHAVPGDHRGKIKESEKRDKCLKLTRELKKRL